MASLDTRAQAVGITVIGLGALLAIVAAIPWASKADIEIVKKDAWEARQEYAKNTARVEADVESLEADRISLHERLAKLEAQGCGK